MEQSSSNSPALYRFLLLCCCKFVHFLHFGVYTIFLLLLHVIFFILRALSFSFHLVSSLIGFLSCIPSSVFIFLPILLLLPLKSGCDNCRADCNLFLWTFEQLILIQGQEFINSFKYWRTMPRWQMCCLRSPCPCRSWARLKTSPSALQQKRPAAGSLLMSQVCSLLTQCVSTFNAFYFCLNKSYIPAVNFTVLHSFIHFFFTFTFSSYKTRMEEQVWPRDEDRGEPAASRRTRSGWVRGRAGHTGPGNHSKEETGRSQSRFLPSRLHPLCSAALRYPHWH